VDFRTGADRLQFTTQIPQRLALHAPVCFLAAKIAFINETVVVPTGHPRSLVYWTDLPSARGFRVTTPDEAGPQAPGDIELDTDGWRLNPALGAPRAAV
jgi:hypothetical protein